MAASRRWAIAHRAAGQRRAYEREIAGAGKGDFGADRDKAEPQRLERPFEGFGIPHYPDKWLRKLGCRMRERGSGDHYHLVKGTPESRHHPPEHRDAAQAQGGLVGAHS